MRPARRTVGIAVSLVTAACVSTARAGSATTMTVNLAADHTGATYDETTLPVVDLNDLAEGGDVRVWKGPTEWWEARYTDPHPSAIPTGSVLTSVVVTIQYKMEPGGWSGTLAVYARTDLGSFGNTTFPMNESVTQAPWDITGLVNGEADPLLTLNELAIRMTNSDATVRVAWSYTKVEVQFEVPPDQPSIISPTIDEVNVGRKPAIDASAFTDPDGNGTHQDTDWEVYDHISLAAGNRVAYGLADPANLVSIALTPANVTFEYSLAGKEALLPNTGYWALVRYRDTYGLESEWSDVRHFTTGVGEPPGTPSITSPGSGATDVSRRPTVTASAYSDPEGDAHTSSDWEIFESPGPADRVALSVPGPGYKTSIDVTDANVTFEGTLAGMSSLAPGTQYWVRVTYRDEYGAASTSAEVDFWTADNLPPDNPTGLLPSGAGASRVPTISADAYDDPDFDPPASSDWEVFDNALLGASDLVASSLNDAAHLESIELNATNMAFSGSLAGRFSLAPNTDYWIRVTYRDAYGGEGVSTAQFTTTVVNVPPAQPTITSPAADEDNVPLNPVIAADAYSDPDGDRHSATYWEVYENPGPADLVAAGANPAVNLTSIEIDAANVVFSGSLAGRTSLAPSTPYWVVVTYRDELEADSLPSATVHFTTGEYPEVDTWPFFGGGCSSTLAGGRGGADPVAGAACLALWLSAVLLLRRRTSA